MALEDIVPRRKDILAWMEEKDEEDSKPGKSQPRLSTKKKRALPPQAKAEMKANYRSAVRSRLVLDYDTLPVEVIDKIMDDFDSYVPELNENRMQREV